ncbi:hypothetical protein N9N44_01640 [Candidatus Pelagibacter bacterium]|nr:hypothetical protein [Candidatus Pelagibacter bacterium]MDA8831395.1 hypothetical protein [Candidatus Pelagibacter bacterium]
MKFFLSIIVFILFLSGCVKHVGIHNKDDSSFFTSSFETKTGGSISDHILFGKSSIELVNIATLRCKKISTMHKVKNFRQTFLGTIITDQMSIYEYDCEEDK